MNTLSEVPARPTAPQTDTPEVRRENVPVGHGGGLHARPSALIQGTAKRFRATVSIEFDGQQANARSTIALMGLGVEEGDLVTVTAVGQDAEEAVSAIAQALEHAPATVDEPAAPASPPSPTRTLPAHCIGGVCASPGLAIGRIVVLRAAEIAVAADADDAVAEIERLHEALATVREQTARQICAAEQRGARQESEIFSAHLALLDDPELIDSACADIDAGRSAGYAFRNAVRAQCEALSRLGNTRLAERASDLHDLERRVLGQLSGEQARSTALFEASILLADDLAPSELTRLPRERIAGIATADGGATSHVAILARAMGIPALVAAGPALLALPHGREVLLNGSEGWIDPAPPAADLAAAAARIEARQRLQTQMQAQSGTGAITLDGIKIEVAANIGSVDDARVGVSNGADAVGLTRTEFLFIDRTEAPGEAQQLAMYQAIIDALAGRPAIIRTLDIGGDKAVPYLTLPPEQNPALGLRGIRSGQANPQVLDTQLRALLSVQPQSALRIMIPMVTDISDLRYVRSRIDALSAELGLAEPASLGVMIEVPTAALLADQLAEHADFLSIGTNDLSQYALAMDRCNPALANRIDALHPGLLRLIAATVEGARRHGRWVGVCGALASDPEATPVLVGLGVSELSVSPGSIPEIKARVRTLDGAVCRAEAQTMLALDSAAAVRQFVRERWPQG
jgi:phosphoenolpyruvate-protein phosphotransferase